MSDEQQPQTPQPAQPEWIPVAPPHPYAAQPAASGGSGRGLAIASMAIGLLGLLTSIVSGLYFSVFVFAGALLGAIAVVLGIVALVKRQRPVAASITGLIAGALAFVLMIVVGVLGFLSIVTDALDGTPAENDGGSEIAEPPAEEGEPLEWPANMSTGGFLFGEGLELTLSAAPAPSTAPAPKDPPRDGSVADIRLYVDYRCPICSLFEQTNGEILEQLVDRGEATLEVIPLTFLDRVSMGTYYSTRASAAMACIADGQPEGAWDAHVTLLSPEVQPEENNGGLSVDEMIEVLDEATGGLSSDVKSCIEQERFVMFAQALNDWVFQTTVPFAQDPSLTVRGTPFAVVNGVPYPGAPDDNAAFRAFLKEQGL